MDSSHVDAVATDTEQYIVRIQLDPTKVLRSTKSTGMINSLECCTDTCVSDSASEKLNHATLHENAIHNQPHQSRIQPHPRQYTVKVKNLSGKVTDEELKKVFSYSGKVQSLKINEVPEPFNYAYVNYTSQEAATKAVKKLNGTKLHGTRIRVTLHNKGHWQPDVSSSRSRKTEQYKVKVECISGLITEEILQRFFLLHGCQSYVQLDKTSEPFNHAYINFDCFEDAQRVVDELSGKCIAIDQDYVSLFFVIDGKSTKHRKLQSSEETRHYSSEKSLEVVQSHTAGASSKNHSSAHIAPTAVCNEKSKQLSGVHIQCATVKDDNKTSSCNIVPSILPQLACDSGPFLSLNLASHKDTSSTAASNETKEARSVPCTPLVAKILLSCCSEDVTKLRGAVSIKPNKLYSEFILSGSATNITLAEEKLKELLQSVQSAVVKTICTFPCHYLPLLSNISSMKKVCKVEDKHIVCFKVVNECNKRFSIRQCAKKLQSIIKSNKDAVKTKQMSILLNEHVPALQCIGAQCHSWLWENDFMGYIKYPSDNSELLTKQFLSSKHIPFRLNIGHSSYNINLTSMKQTNVKTGYERSIQLEIKHTDLCDMNPERCKHKPSHRLCIEIEGHKECLDSAISDLKREMETCMIESKVNVNMKSSTILDLTDLYCVEAQITDSILILRGAEDYVSKVTILVQNACIEHLKGLSSTYSRPSHWVNQPENLYIHSVDKATPEWKEVAGLVYKTLPNATILKLERIQNEWLWKRYYFAKQRMIEKNGLLNESKLFHGTSLTPPDKIYQSQQGFDFRCSGEMNMWGTGTYFAVNASYSDSYSHQLANNEKEIFLADVLTGVTCQCKPDSKLKKPPPKASGANDGELYDSVTGHTNGSDIFVIYELDQAYPAYVITYKCVRNYI